MTQPEPLTLNQAAEAAGVSRSTVKRRLPELEKAGAHRLPSGEWRIPRDALALLNDGSHGSTDEPRDPPSDPRPEPRDPRSDEPREPREPRPEPREPLAAGVSDELRDALAAARLEAAEWRARAEERADRIAELAARAEAAEARLDRMITSQTALALTLKEHQQTNAVSDTVAASVERPATPEPERPATPEPERPATPEPERPATPEPERPAAGGMKEPAPTSWWGRLRGRR